MYSSFHRRLVTLESVFDREMKSERIHLFREDWLVTLGNVLLVLRAKNGYVPRKLKKIAYVSFSGNEELYLNIY